MCSCLLVGLGLCLGWEIRVVVIGVGKRGIGLKSV